MHSTSSLCRWGFTTKNIFPTGYYLKMFWIHTGSISTKVIKFKS